ncbi:MAG: hypothetical protein U1D30_08660 [Planctomycetota bacterium]
MNRFVFPILEACQDTDTFIPETFATPTKQWNISELKVLQTVVEVPSGTVNFRFRHNCGNIMISWWCNETASPNVISGEVESPCVAFVLSWLERLCNIVGATYGLADKAGSSSCDAKYWFLEWHPISTYAVVDLCWFNWFGYEYRDVLSLDIDRPAGTQIIRTATGETVVILASEPDEVLCRTRAKELSKSWPYFVRLKEDSRFPEEITPDYSDIQKERTVDGQFKAGGAIFYTLRTRRRLEELGLISEVDSSDVLMPMILPRYCKMLEIDMEDMIWLPCDPRFAARNAAIDSAYARSDTSLPTRSRIWMAHFKASKLYFSEPLLELVHDLYFPDVPQPTSTSKPASPK